MLIPPPPSLPPDILINNWKRGDRQSVLAIHLKSLLGGKRTEQRCVVSDKEWDVKRMDEEDFLARELQKVDNRFSYLEDKAECIEWRDGEM